MFKNNKTAIKSILSSIICVFFGLILGFIIMLILSLISDSLTPFDAVRGFFILLLGPFSSGTYALTNFGDMIFYSAPLIFTGLSVAIAFNTGLFNIGAPGQMLIGTASSLMVALNFQANNSFESVLIWILAILVAIVCGMLWGMVPGFFKAFFGVNEVIVCIMTNWIMANMVSWFFSGMGHLVDTGFGKTGYLKTTAQTLTGTPKLGLDKIFSGSYIDIGIFLAIISAIIIYIILNKTTLGFELKACGFNKDASKYAGMNEKKNIMLSMAIAGGLAALGGAVYYLNPGIEFKYIAAYTKLPDYGFNGIPASLLALNNPIGVIFSGIFLRYLSQGGDNLVSAGFNRYVSDIIISIIIYFAGFSNFIRYILSIKKNKNKEEEK